MNFEDSFHKDPSVDVGPQVLKICQSKAEALKQFERNNTKNFNELFWKKYYSDFDGIKFDTITDHIALEMSKGESSVCIIPLSVPEDDKDLKIFSYIVKRGCNGDVPLLDSIRQKFPSPEFKVFVKGKLRGITIEWKNKGSLESDEKRRQFGWFVALILAVVFWWWLCRGVK
jgi:hypothetical protein